jgi:hypothetical protein
MFIGFRYRFSIIPRQTIGNLDSLAQFHERAGVPAGTGSIDAAAGSIGCRYEARITVALAANLWLSPGSASRTALVI